MAGRGPFIAGHSIIAGRRSRTTTVHSICIVCNSSLTYNIWLIPYMRYLARYGQVEDISHGPRLDAAPHRQLNSKHILRRHLNNRATSIRHSKRCILSINPWYLSSYKLYFHVPLAGLIHFPGRTASPAGPAYCNIKLKRARYQRSEDWAGSAHPWSMEPFDLSSPGTSSELTHHSWHKETSMSSPNIDELL